MNIFDLSWSRLYLYVERHQIGISPINTAIYMMGVTYFYTAAIVYFPFCIGVSKIPFTSDIPIVIYMAFLFLFFLLRNIRKETREKRLSAYCEYLKEHPRKTKVRFLIFTITPFLLCVIDCIILNTRYAMTHGS